MPDPVVLRAFANLVDACNDFIGVADADGRILYVNPSGRRMIGRSPNVDLSGLHIHDVFPEWSVGAFIREGMVDQLTNLSMNRDATLLTAHGGRIPISLSVVAHLSDEYHVDHFSLFARDVSEQEQIAKAWDTVEKRLEEFFRMRVISKMAAGLATNLEASINRIGQNVGDALNTTPENGETHRSLNGAFKDLNDARETIHRMVSAAMPHSTPSARNEPARVLDAVREAVLIARSSMPATIVVREDFGSECGTVATDSIQIQQIVMILFLNARDAVQDNGGVIEVRLDSLDADERRGMEGTRKKPCRYARITVSDNGAGMDPESLAFVFEPHLRESTTFDERLLSLSVVNKIVDNCGGAVTIHNRSGRGTSYQVYLPLCEEAAPGLAP